MTHIPFKLTLLAITLATAACSSTPSNNLLTQAQSDFRALQESPMAATYAPLETKQAGDALALANQAAELRESAAKVDHLAYLAQQKIALTRESIKQKSAEAEIAQAGNRSNQLRLEQRTAEADQSNVKAQMARNESANAKYITQLALNEAADARRNTVLAHNQANDAKQDAKSAQAEAAEEKRKAQLANNQALNAKEDTQSAQAEAASSQRMAQEAHAKNAQLEAQLTALSAKKTAHGIVITLSDVLFGTDLSRLNTEGIRNIQKLADLLRENPSRIVLVEGFTDSTGSAAHNQALSERRASAVRKALVDMGVHQERISMHGYGEELPVAANDTAANRQLNRRVEIVLSDDKGIITPR